MAEHEHNDPRVQIEYFTADRMGQRYEVPLSVALTDHKTARVVAYADGSPFEGSEARADMRDTRAAIREERAAEREQAAVEEEKPAKASKVKDGE